VSESINIKPLDESATIILSLLSGNIKLKSFVSIGFSTGAPFASVISLSYLSYISLNLAFSSGAVNLSLSTFPSVKALLALGIASSNSFCSSCLKVSTAF